MPADDGTPVGRVGLLKHGGPGLRGQSWRWWWRYAVYVDHLEAEAGDPLHEPGQGTLIGYLGVQGGRIGAYGDLAVIEFRAQRGAGLAHESDLICL
jgi:hypothetical protein